MRIVVVIPWRSQESRKWARGEVQRFYNDQLPDAKLIYVDTKDPTFNLAGARNAGVRIARDEYGADVVVLNDADTIPEPKSLHKAIARATHVDRVVLPYDRYCSLQERGTQDYKDRMYLKDCHHFYVENACSGVYIFRPEVWWMHYGQDERFRGWGYEDSAWRDAHETLLGEIVRIKGNVYAFHHESAVKEGEHFTRNAQLCYKYHEAHGHKSNMINLILNQCSEQQFAGFETTD